MGLMRRRPQDLRDRRNAFQAMQARPHSDLHEPTKDALRDLLRQAAENTAKGVEACPQSSITTPVKPQRT